MKTRFSERGLPVLALAIAAFAIAAYAEQFQLVSALDPSTAPAAGGSGDSWGPILSADGRYVLFSSTANNLVVATNGCPIPARIPPSLNVYLRDRLNGTTRLISVNVSGVAGGNGDSLPVALSTNGQFVLFESSASDLVPGDTNNASDVFVRDLVNGNTILVSVATNGLPGNGGSRSPVMTPDGSTVAFVSAADNLVPGDTNRIADVFVRDLRAGTTLLASVGAVSTRQTGSSEAPEITPDGRYVAFYSSASNLVYGVPIGSDIYIRDLTANTTIWASVYARTVVRSNNAACFSHAFSADGHWLAYEACSNNATIGAIFRYSLDTGLTDLVATNAAVPRTGYEDIRSLDISTDGRFITFVGNTNTTDGTTTCIRLWDAQSGAVSLVSGNLSNAVPIGSVSDWPTIDPGGRYIAFLCSATNMVTNATSADFHLYLRDLQAGTTALLDADTNGTGSAISYATAPRLSADGRFVVFECADASLVPNDRNRDLDVFLRDLSTGSTELLSAHDPALPTTTPNGPSTLSLTSVSGHGRYVAFASEADNLTPNDTNGFRDVFVRDLASGTTILVSVGTNGASADGNSCEPALSSDGRYVAFTSFGDNLVPGDANRYEDVFVRDLLAGTTVLVSRNSSGTGSGSGPSFSPLTSRDARYVLFRSKANNLTSGANSLENLYLRDMQVGVTVALTIQGVTPLTPAITPDGRFNIYAAYASSVLSPPSFVYVWDALLGQRIYTNSSIASGSTYGVAITPDGRRIAFANSSGLWVSDLDTGTNRLIDPTVVGFKDVRLSEDGQWLVAARAPHVYHLYLYDLSTTNRVLIDYVYNSPANPSDCDSDSPTVSPDGRFVAYHSLASNIVAGYTNAQPGIFLYDRLTGLNSLLSATPSGSPPNHRSLTPVFSADGTTLLFESWASDLVAGDFNHSSDLFAYTFLTAVLVPSDTSGQGPWLSWPWVAGRNYHVEYKDTLNGSDWLELSGSITNIGNKAWLQDTSPPAGQRFYRVLSF